MELNPLLQAIIKQECGDEPLARIQKRAAQISLHEELFALTQPHLSAEEVERFGDNPEIRFMKERREAGFDDPTLL